MHGTAWLLWLGFAVAMLVVEAATVDFVFLMLALGALAGALASFLGAGFALAVFVAIAVAILGLWLVRPVLRRTLRSSQRKNNDIGVRSLIGSYGHVVEEIDDKRGLLKIGGDQWTARTTTGAILAVGETARVVDLQGATLVVEPLNSSPYPRHS